MATRTITSAITLPALTLAGSLQRPPRIDAGLTLPTLSIGGTLTKQLVLPINADLGLPALALIGNLSRPNKVESAIVLPGLVVAAALRIPIRTRLMAEWGICRQALMAQAASWSMSARDAASTLAAPWALTHAARAQHDLVWHGPRVLASQQDFWSLRVGMQHVLVWPVGNVTAELRACWSGPLCVGHECAWSSAPVVRTGLQAGWACLPRIRVALIAPWGRMRSAIRNRCELSWSGTVRCRIAAMTRWSLRDTRVMRQQDAQWLADDRVSVVSVLAARWAGDEGRILSLPEIALWLGDQSIPVTGCELRSDPDSAAATALVTPVIWPNQLPSAGTRAVLSMGGTDWQMVLTSGDGQASAPMTLEATVQLASPCVALDNAEPVTLPYGGLASEIAAAAVAPLALTWNLPDWYLLPPLVAAQLGAQSPLAVARALANAAGGLLMSLPSGDLVAVPRQGGAVLDLGCAIESERSIAAAQYAGVRVRAEEPGADIHVSGEMPDIRILDIAVLPWRPVNTELHAGSDAVLSAPAEVSREVTEQVRIIDGVTELSMPPDALIRTEWSDGAERILRHRGRWAWTEERDFNGLCTVTYRHRVLRLTASRTLQRDALAVVHEQEKIV